MGYIEKMVTGIMPRVKYMGLAEFCDVFCEDGVFSIEESEYILKIAKKMGCKCEKNDIGSIEVGKKADFIKRGSYQSKISIYSMKIILNLL